MLRAGEEHMLPSPKGSNAGILRAGMMKTLVPDITRLILASMPCLTLMMMMLQKTAL